MIFLTSHVSFCREMPDWETHTVADTLNSLLSCEFDDVKHEALLNIFYLQFWEDHTNLRDFTRCLLKQKVNEASCYKVSLRVYCNKRFGVDQKKTLRCANISRADSTLQSPPPPHVTEYRECIASQLNLAQPCLAHLLTRCRRSPIRGVKTVRGTMEEAALLLRRNPNAKIVHLFRDPRAVLLSRMRGDSYRSYSTKKDITHEAKFYCGILDKDLHFRDELVKRYPNSIKELIYEDFVRDPLGKAKEVYDFLGIDLVPEVKEWLLNSTAKSVDIAKAWRDKITPVEQRAIELTCAHLFSHAADVWT